MTSHHGLQLKVSTNVILVGVIFTRSAIAEKKDTKHLPPLKIYFLSVRELLFCFFLLFFFPEHLDFHCGLLSWAYSCLYYSYSVVRVELKKLSERESTNTLVLSFAALVFQHGCQVLHVTDQLKKHAVTLTD